MTKDETRLFMRVSDNEIPPLLADTILGLTL
jgi:hypothetical protein